MSLELGTICLQSLIVLLSLFAVFRGRKFIIGFALGFGVYLYFNLATYYHWNFKILGENGQSILLFLAIVAITFSIWEIYRN